MRQQDLVWVKLPFTNLEGHKIRPAVIVSNEDYNKKYRDIIVCAVTSNLEEAPHSILIDPQSLSDGELPVKSKIRADKIMQIEKKLVIRSFARLKDETFDTLAELIARLVKRTL